MGRRKAAVKEGESPVTTRAAAAIPAVLAALFVLGAVVRIVNMNVEVRSPDEKIYTAQARSAVIRGIIGTREVVQSFEENRDLWIYPPPTRIGYAWLLAVAMKVSGTQSEQVGSWVSCLASMLTMLVAMRLGLRFLGPWPTVAGTLFLAVFPPELVIARRCWSDALVELAALGMIYCVCEIWAGTKNTNIWILLPVVGSVAVLIKETTVLIYAPCLALALWAALRRSRDVRQAALLMGVALACTAAASGLLAICTGNIPEAVRLLINQARGNATNTYALEMATGPGYLLLLGFAKLSPLTTVLALWGLGVTVVRRRSGLIIAWLTVANLAVYMIVPHWLNLRYASASFAPLCLFAGVGLWELVLLLTARAGTGAYRWALAGAAAAALVFTAGDYQRFTGRWLTPNAMDLTVKMVSDIMQD